jgi:PAS domain S-box-containing protein
LERHNLKKEIDSEKFRCSDCGKLLAIANESDLVLSIKCTRCGSLNSIFKGVTEQVVITDQDGVILYANSMVESITGYSLQEILGKKPSLWGGQMSKEFYKEMWRMIKQEKKSIMVEVKNKKKDGTLYKAKLRISPVFGLKNEITMFVGVESVI